MNNHRETKQLFRISFRPPMRMRKRSQFRKLRWTSPKEEPMRKSEASHVSSMEKGLQKAANAGPTGLWNPIFSLPSIFKKQSGIPSKAVVFHESRERYLIESRKAQIFWKIALAIALKVKTLKWKKCLKINTILELKLFEWLSETSCVFF